MWAGVLKLSTEVHPKCLTGTRDMRTCVVFVFRFVAFVLPAFVCFADDGGEGFSEPGASLFVVGDVESGVEGLVREPTVGVSGSGVGVVCGAGTA